MVGRPYCMNNLHPRHINVKFYEHNTKTDEFRSCTVVHIRWTVK